MSERYVLYFDPWLFSVGLITVIIITLSTSWQVFNLACSLEFRQSLSAPAVSSMALLAG